MTSKQRNSLMIDWWPRAARAQGWPVANRSLRLQILSRAVGRHLASANDLDNSRDIDAVKAHLGMLADNLQATIETVHPELGEARRQKFLIQQLSKELGRPYIDAIMRDKFGHTRIDDLDLPHLTQLRDTLNARAHMKRRRQAQTASIAAAPDNQHF